MLLAEELGIVVDWVQHTLKVAKEPGERVSDYIKRAFKSQAMVTTDRGEMNRIVLPEKAAAVVLGFRQRKDGNGAFGNVPSDANDRQGDYGVSVKRDGKTDRIEFMGHRSEYRRLTNKTGSLNRRLGEVASRREDVAKKAGDMKRNLALDKEAYARKSAHERDLGVEQAHIDQVTSMIAQAEAQLPGLDHEIESIKNELIECERATLSKYSSTHHVPAKVELEVEIRWPVQ